MENYSCPNCGSSKQPITKSIWSKKDKILAIVLLLAFFPFGIIYIIIKQSSNKQLVCPDCKKAYTEVQETSVTDDINAIKKAVIDVAKDPNVRNAAKEAKESLKELQESFNI